MKKSLGCVIVLTLSLFAVDASGDGDKLLKQCTSALNAMNPEARVVDFQGAEFCRGFITGLVDLNTYYQSLLGHNALFCPPESGIPTTQATRTVVKYLKKHPEKLREEERFLAVKALAEAYPCK